MASKITLLHPHSADQLSSLVLELTLTQSHIFPNNTAHSKESQSTVLVLWLMDIMETLLNQ